MNYLNLTELDETAMSLVTVFLQAKAEGTSPEEISASVESLSEDLTIDEFQVLTYLLSSLAADLVQSWAGSSDRDVGEVWRTIALAKAEQREF